MTNLTLHFSLEELIASPTATRLGIDNHPTVEEQAHLARLAAVLEQIRTACDDRPLVISSGYRCPALNMRLGGSPFSAHMAGKAADFTIPGLAVRTVCERIVDCGVAFHQLIFEGSWVHIAVGEPNGHWEREVLTAHFAGGRVTYTPGLPA